MFRRFADSVASRHVVSLLRNHSVFAPVAQTRSLRRTVGFALIALIFPIAAFAYTSPGKPVGLVNDFAGVIPTADSIAIGEKLVALEKATGDEVVVVTVKSLGDETIESYANELFKEWGIGKADKDNGLLILVSTGDHKARIEVGYGLEGTVTDLQSGNIIRKVMIPAFKQDDYAGGIAGAVDAVTEIITGSPDAVQYSVPAEENDSEDWGSIAPVIFFFIAVVLSALARFLGRSKSWWLGGMLGALAGVIIGAIWGLGIGLVVGIVLGLLGLLFDFIVSKGGGKGGRGPGGMGSLWPLWFIGGNRWGGRSGGSSGGSSFGGFGGGSSGGGGASGSW